MKKLIVGCLGVPTIICFMGYYGATAAEKKAQKIFKAAFASKDNLIVTI